jgi:hypothetical protein
MIDITISGAHTDAVNPGRLSYRNFMTDITPFTSSGGTIIVRSVCFPEGAACSDGTCATNNGDPVFDPCADLLGPPDLPVGYVCENLQRIDTPSGQDPLNTYFQAEASYVPDTTRVWIDGLFLIPTKYIEHPSSGYIEVDVSVDVGGGDVFDPGKGVYMCYTALGSL